jgi:hypothetical protein
LPDVHATDARCIVLTDIAAHGQVDHHAVVKRGLVDVTLSAVGGAVRRADVENPTGRRPPDRRQ